MKRYSTFYVDTESGSDDNDGASVAKAWRTLARANRAPLAAGRRLLLAGGQTFHGPLKFDSTVRGDAQRRIVIESYGSGRAVIDAGDGDGIVLTGAAYVTVRNLNLVGSGRNAGSNGSGVVLTQTLRAQVTDVDCSGFRLCGVTTAGDIDTRLVRVAAHDNGSAGISTLGGYNGIPRTRNLYIGYCTADNNPGDPKNLTNHSGNGIVVGGLDGGVIEYCEASNNGWDMPRKGNGPVGIWGWDCDRLTIQHCIAHDNKSPGGDGDGFDFDGGVTNSVMQYNLSYNNVGTGYLLCQYPGAPKWNNNVVRYNVSFNDGSRNFQSGIGLWIGGDGISGAQVYNNTIVNPWHAVSTSGDVPGIVYRNNVFVSGGDLLTGAFTKSRFENNLYWNRGAGLVHRDTDATYATLEEWSRRTGAEMRNGSLAAIHADPRLVLPASASQLPTNPRDLPRMRYFRLSADSPCLRAGEIIQDAGERDLFGRRIPTGVAPSVGASQE